MKKRTANLYSTTDNSIVHHKEETLAYNDKLLLVSHTSNDSKGGKKKVVYTYPADVYALNGAIVYGKMVNKNMLNYPIETVEYKDGKVIKSSLTEYMDDNGLLVPSKTLSLKLAEPIDSTAFTPYSGVEKDFRYQLNYETLDVDRWGNPLCVRSSNGDLTSYLWGYNANYPVMKVQNAQNTYKNQLIYTNSLETESINLDPGNIYSNNKAYEFTTSRSGDVEIRLSGALGFDWYVTGNLDGKSFSLVQTRSDDSNKQPWINYVNAFTWKVVFTGIRAGTHTLRISATDVNYKSGQYLDKGYLTYSYWGYTTSDQESGHDELLFANFEKNSGSEIVPFGFHSSRSFVGPYSIHLNGESDRKCFVDYQVYRAGIWHYVRSEIIGRDFIIDEGLNPIDEVRVYPQDAQVTSYSYIPFVGMRSTTDGRGVVEVYRYDSFGRLQSIADSEGDMLKTYNYHYYNQPPIVNPTVTYGNVTLSRSFTSSTCNAVLGEKPIPVDYTIPAGKYQSDISQEDANRMAFDDLIENGQRYADENGECRSYVMISVYNPTFESLILEYMWGINGHIQSTYYEIPPSECVAANGDVITDYKPTVLYLDRMCYRQALMYFKGQRENPINFTIFSTPYNTDICYDIFNYPENNDTYIVGPY